jgi:hypothetical protein
MVFKGSALNEVQELPLVTGDALQTARNLISDIVSQAKVIKQLLWSGFRGLDSHSDDEQDCLNTFFQEGMKCLVPADENDSILLAGLHWWRLVNRISNLYFSRKNEEKSNDHQWFKTSWAQIYARAADLSEDGEGGEYLKLLLEQLNHAHGIWKNFFISADEVKQDSNLTQDQLDFDALNHYEVISYEALREFSLLCNPTSTFSVDGDSILATEVSLLFWYRYFGPFTIGTSILQFMNSLRNFLIFELHLQIPDSNLFEKVIRNAMDGEYAGNSALDVEDFDRFLNRFGPLDKVYLRCRSLSEPYMSSFFFDNSSHHFELEMVI